MLLECLPQERVRNRPTESLLLVVGAGAMATLYVFEIPDIVSLLFHARVHLSRMGGMHAVIPRRGREEHLWVTLVFADILIGRVFREVGPLFGLVGIAVLRHPGSAGKQLVIALHIQQRYLTHHRAE